jgi:hypothetical protein
MGSSDGRYSVDTFLRLGVRARVFAVVRRIEMQTLARLKSARGPATNQPYAKKQQPVMLCTCCDYIYYHKPRSLGRTLAKDGNTLLAIDRAEVEMR